MPPKNASYYFSPDVLELSDILLATEDKECDYKFQDEFNQLATTPTKNVPNQPKLSKSPPTHVGAKKSSLSQSRPTSSSPSPKSEPEWIVAGKSSAKATANSPKKRASDTSSSRQSVEKNDAHASPTVSCLKKTGTPSSAKSVKFAELADQFEVENFKKWNKRPKEWWLSRPDVARQVQNEALVARYEQLWADLHHSE